MSRANLTPFFCDDPEMAAIFDRKLRARSKDTPGGCRIWVGYCPTKEGYGAFKYRRRRYLTHRAAWIVAHGAIPDGLLVLHSCDTPGCINAEHLFLGDDATNCHDRDRKGRQRSPRGAAHWSAKFSEAQVREFRRRRGAGEKVTALAEEAGISQGHMSNILTRRQWASVK